MDDMKQVTRMLRVMSVPALMLTLTTAVAWAQQTAATPSPSPQKSADAKTQSPAAKAADTMGDYAVTSSVEFGYRGLKVDGDLNKYQSDLNYKAGPRLFDSSLLLKAKDGKDGGLFDTILVTSTGWGADPYGHMRISAENSKWYRFDGQYRRFRYFNFLNNFANPNFATRPTDPVTGQHGYDTRQQIGDFDLTLLPKNERVRFNIGFSPERYSGPAYTTYHSGGDDFMLLSNLRSRSNDFRVGADWKLGPVNFSLLQGFRRFREDSTIDLNGRNLGDNPALSNALLTSFHRNEPVRGHVNFTRFSAHTLIAKRLDMTGRLIYSSATTNFGFVESFAGNNWNTRVTGALNPPNILTLGQYNLTGNGKRPNTLGDFGATYMATNKLRISNTFRVETFQINGGDLYGAAFFLSRTNGTATAPVLINNFSVYKVTKYRKLQDTIEGDYQFNEHYSAHFGYRYGSRRIEEILSGFGLNANLPAALTPEDVIERNHTDAFFGGFKARPVKNWTVYFDAEHGTADNVFTRVGNYDYTNVRARSRYAPTHNLSFNLAVITRNNSNPSAIDGVSLQDFGVDVRSRVFSSSIDYAPTSRLSFSGGYSYNRADSDAVVDYFFNSVRHPNGHSLYFMRNNFFFLDTVAQVAPHVTFYAAYRINKDTGQGDRRADPTGTPGFLITSYPMSYQSPEGRLSIRLNRRLDWNLGYQYYNYNESPLVSVRPQNYHAHMPYTSLRLYFGGGER
jgi:hypothetical protein